MIKIEIKEGEDQKFRWFAYRDGEYQFHATPDGFDTKEEAQADAMDDLTQDVTIEIEDGEYYAGPREFHN